MLTYQVRPRVFRLEEGTTFVFPADGDIRFVFSPLQPFGMEASGGKTAVQSKPASVLFNANSGAHTIESRPPLEPLEVEYQEATRILRLNGNILTISQRFESLTDVREFIEPVYFALPALLNVEFGDPPIVERVEGSIGGTHFRWELKNWRAEFRITTQEAQEAAVALSWERMGLLSEVARRRLLAALHYFHVAVRLERQGIIAGEFLPEMLLNLSKVLEVLFPPDGDGRTRDAAREGLSRLGYSSEEIEADYIPAMALRNEINVGHVDLALFKPEHLALIHAYVGRAEFAFRELLQRLLRKIQAGETDVVPHHPAPAHGDSIAVIDRLRVHAERYAL